MKTEKFGSLCDEYKKDLFTDTPAFDRCSPPGKDPSIYISITNQVSL
jgi:hypothetical protein